MRDVDTSIRCHRISHRDQLFGGREISWRINKRGSDPESSIDHGVMNEPPHLPEFFGIWSP